MVGLQSTVGRCAVLLVVIALLGGCAGTMRPAYNAQEVMAEHGDLLKGESIFGAGAQLPELPDVDLLAVNDQMRAFLAANTVEGASDQYNARKILEALLEDGLRLHYNNLKTYTAAEAFAAREGNCLSFTNLYIALAREAGIIASYQEVEVPPAWSALGDTMYFNLHINVLLDLTRNRQQVIDFDTQADTSRGRAQVVGDRTAASQYYNNTAVHYLEEGDLESAFLHARKAIRMRPVTGYFWSNLGTIYKRAGDLDRAEEAYRVAIDLTGEPAAMSNLARLYRLRGDNPAAEELEQRVEIYRRQNPYYLYQLAQLEYGKARYEEANALMRRAVRKRKDEHEFFRLLGLTWLQLGNADKAEESFSKAAEVASDPKDSSLYAQKLRRLAQRS